MDNVTFQTTTATPPSGTIVATDEVQVGGIQTAGQVQFMKLVDGTLNGTDPLPGTSANGLDVDVTRIASGGSVDIGAVADAAITTDATGSLSGKLRGLVKWAFERMPASLGQKTKANSFPVVLASDQDALAVSLTSTTITGTVDTELTTADLDTGAGTDTRAVAGLVYGASGGGILVSTTNPLPVGDNGSSLTIDAASLPLPTGAATAANQATAIGHLDGVEGLLTTIDADTGTIAGTVAGSEVQVDVVGALPAGANAIGKLAANSGIDIGDVDVTSVTPGTATSSLGKAEDAGHASGDVGVMSLAVRQDANATLAGTDLDYAPLQVDATGSLKVAIISGAGSGGTAMGDDAAFTPGTTSITPVGGTYRSVRDTVNDNDAGAFAMTQSRAILATIETPAGDTAMDDTNDAVRVNVVAGSGAGVTHTDDAAFTPGTDDGVPMFAMFDDVTPDSVNEGDAGIVRMSANRNLYVTLRDAAGNERGLNVDASGNIGVTDAGGALTVDNGGTFAVQAAQSGTWNVTNVSGTVSLPTGAATLAEQQSQTTSLQLIDDVVVADDAAFTPGTTKVLMVGATLDDTTPDTVNEGDGGAVRMTSDRALHNSIRDSAGNNRGANVNASNQLTVSVDNTVTVASHAVTNGGTFAVQESGAALTALQLIDNIVLAEDAVHGSGDPGVQALAVRKDSGAAIAGTDGDYSPLQVDSSGNLRVNVAAGGAGDGAILDGVSSSIKATVLDFTNSNPLAVRLTDTNGDYVGAGAGTQYTEDVAAAADPTGTMVMAVRADSLAAVTSADGDNIAARATNKGELYVKHVDALPAGTNNIGDVDVLTLPALAAGTNNIGDVDVLSIAAGDNNIGNVDIVTMPNVTLAAGTNTNEVVGDVAQDVAAAGNPLLIGGRASAAAPTDMSADGDAVYLWTTLKGAVNVADAGGSLTIDGTVTANLAAGTNNIGDVDVLSIAAGDNNIGNVDVVTMPGVVGTIADDATTPGNPVMMGGKAVETDGTDPTSVSAEDDAAILRTDRNRRLLVNTAHPNQWTARENHTSAQTNNELKAAPGANLSLYITDMIMSTDVATNIKLVRDTAGTPADIAGPFYFAANGGMAMPLVTPIRVTANQNIGFTGGATGNFTVEVHGYIAP